MANYEERRVVVEETPDTRSGVIETQHDTVLHERRGISGPAIAALVLAAVAAAVMITLMLTNNSARDEELARERAAAAQTQATQPAPQQPQVVVVPQPQQSQPSTVIVPAPVPAPAPPQSAPSTSDATTSNITTEVDITTKLLDDQDLRTHPINVKFENGTATLSGSVPSDDLKMRAEKIAMSIKGVRRVVNDITVRQQ